MEEKIKIYVPKEIDAILFKDAEMFEFNKKDGKLNKNAFINTLIVNYYESYQKQIDDNAKKIINILSEFNCKESKLTELSYRILNGIDENSVSSFSSKTDKVISLKPTKVSSSIIEYIINNCLNGMTLSGYFRRMFESYCKMPQDKREEIIFLSSFETIRKAISQGKMIYFTNSLKGRKHIVCPYSIARSQEELFNYLICKEGDIPYSYRISRMYNVMVHNEVFEFNSQEKTIMQKMNDIAPSFSYGNFNNTGLIKVQMNDYGKKLYKKVYYLRPKIVKQENDIFYFDCSEGQAEYYFQRFGSSAVILSPIELTEKMQENYQYASKKYQRVKDKEKRH